MLDLDHKKDIERLQEEIDNLKEDASHWKHEAFHYKKQYEAVMDKIDTLMASLMEGK